MLTIIIPEQEAFNEKTNSFVKIKPCELKLEHSLLSLWKWESKHHKYFLENKDLNSEEIIDYIRCMTLNKVDDYVYDFLTEKNIEDIKEYLVDPMSATWFSDSKKPQTGRKEIVTAELIYSSMIILNIPVEIFEKRHLNHVLTLIRVCSEKQNPDTNKNKQNPKEVLQHYSELNKARKAKLNTKG